MIIKLHIMTSIYDRYMTLSQGKSTQIEYIWIDGNEGLRSKARTLDFIVTNISQLPIWNYDGSSTNQAGDNASEVYLKPIAFYPDPFRRGNNILVLCETCEATQELIPIPSNTRHNANKIMEEAENSIPWFGLEQEYMLMDPNTNLPLGWPENGSPKSQGPYYCSVGSENAFGRMIVESHYRACLYSGIKISGINAEVCPGQWEYQVGPCVGIDAGDQLWMSRYLLQRVCEDFNVSVSFEPKLYSGWNGSGMHTNFSTKEMRVDGGYKHILNAIEKLSENHLEHIKIYGKNNEKRLTGLHETSSMDKFTYGVANRNCSVRIPSQVVTDKKGYLEDRRPASNCDPYLVTSKIVETTVVYHCLEIRKIKFDNGMYEGQVRNNKKHGKGKMIYNDGDVYEGEWKNDQQEGKGKMNYFEGDIYKGNWENNQKNGKGFAVYDNGNTYDGEWKNERKHGKGTMNYENGDIYDGDWVNDKMYGNGKMIYSTGETCEGEWNDGKFVNIVSAFSFGLL